MINCVFLANKASTALGETLKSWFVINYVFLANKASTALGETLEL